MDVVFARDETLKCGALMTLDDREIGKHQGLGQLDSAERSRELRDARKEQALAWGRVLKGEPTEKDKTMVSETVTAYRESAALEAQQVDEKFTERESIDEDRRKEANRTIGFSTEQFNGVFGFSIPLHRLELGDNLGLREALAKRLDETRKKMTMERGVDRREQKRRFAPQVRSLFEEFAPSSEARDEIRRDFERGMEDPRTAARDEQTDRVRQRDRSDRNQR